MNKFSHILSTNYVASVNQTTFLEPMCGADLLLDHDDDIINDDDDDDDEEEEEEPSWKLYARMAFCLGDDCSSGAKVEGGSA